MFGIGGGGGGAGVGATTETANCCWMIWVTIAELSIPQYWQTNRGELAAISGVTSIAYLTPHWHRIFSSILRFRVKQDYTLRQD